MGIITFKGDSGGPLVRINPKTNRYEIIGVVSTGGVCGGKRQAGIRPFLKIRFQVIGKNCNNMKIKFRNLC
jgi:hypothetical protein